MIKICTSGVAAKSFVSANICLVLVSEQADALMLSLCGARLSPAQNLCSDTNLMCDERHTSKAYKCCL